MVEHTIETVINHIQPKRHNITSYYIIDASLTYERWKKSSVTHPSIR